MKAIKIIVSVLHVWLWLFVSTLFYKTICVMLLVAMWHKEIVGRIPVQWRKWGMRGVWAVLVVVLWIAMPRYRINSNDRVRLFYLNKDGEAVHPPLLQYVMNTLLPEEEIVNFTVKTIRHTGPIVHQVGHLGNRFIKDAQKDFANGKMHNFLDPYDNLGCDNPMSACYSQTFNEVFGTDYKTVYLCKPKQYDEDKTYPLVIFCHGYLGNWQLYQGIWKDFDNAIVLSIGTRGMDGIFGQSHINEIFSFYIPMLERHGYKIDQSQIHLIGLSNGGTAITAAMHSNHAKDFKSISTISCNLGKLRKVPCQVNFVGGGKDNSANAEPSQYRQLQHMGVDAAIFFYSTENHFIMVNRRAEMMMFLKRRMALKVM